MRKQILIVGAGFDGMWAALNSSRLQRGKLER